MKQFVTFVFIILFSFISANAQSFTDHLQKSTQGKGVVTVNQSKEIDELVNGKTNQTVTRSPQNEKDKKTIENRLSTPKKEKGNSSASGNGRPVIKDSNREREFNQDAEIRQRIQENKETPEKREIRRESHKRDTTVNADENFDIPVIDMRKKVMRHSYKVTGYRVQAFAGGNSRKDRITAQKTGNAIKMKYPDQPVYVHFYSPRWICRVGNFRSLNEANKMLRQIRAMGYRSACLVKGKITVQK